MAFVSALSSQGQTSQIAHVYTTTSDRSQSMTLTALSPQGNSTTDAIVITNRQNQEIDGYGYAITYASCYNLLERMSAQQRHELLERTFSHTNGYGVSYVRISIGCNDFSSDEYTLCDAKGDRSDLLQHFRLHSDEINYVIPVLKEIIAINPDIKIIAAPWTPPRWMKYENNDPSQTSTSWTGGRLHPDFFMTYGEYFVKFIRTMESYGIRIHAVSPQNEPLNSGNSASMWMPWDDEAGFVSKGLAPALHNAGLKTKIYIYDHNYNYDNGPWGNDDYVRKVYNQMGTGFVGEELVAGSCWHNYGGQLKDIANDIVWGRQDKELLFSEASIGQWNDGRNLNARLAYEMDELIIGPALHRFRGSLVWNFMLDSNGAPNRPKGCTTCYGAIDLMLDDARSEPRLSYNSHYYIMAHASAVIKPGAHRVDTDGWWTEGLSYAAFHNPDNTSAILFSNNGDKNLNVNVNTDNHTYTVAVPAKSVVSMRMGLDPDLTGVDGVAVDTDNEPVSLYDLQGRLARHPVAGRLYITSKGEKIIF
ncbi:MAG: glycoside hydrolase family 30 beta sandwich domain-containing protein [Bacteroidales bacterium]|nr:glycoside hydrolase family 30 beta sandwich domain-containing protein [Bacteroidales bacterium]